MALSEQENQAEPVLEGAEFGALAAESQSENGVMQFRISTQTTYTTKPTT